MIKEWLRVTVPAFYELPEIEKKAIADFCLLWSLFEGRVLGAGGTANGICKIVDSWDQAGTLRARDYSEELAYFRDRYTIGGAANQRFAQLHFKQRDHGDLVLAVLTEADGAPADLVKACLLIVFRYRSALFHGQKWESELRGRYENFTRANSILMKTLDMHGRFDG